MQGSRVARYPHSISGNLVPHERATVYAWPFIYLFCALAHSYLCYVVDVKVNVAQIFAWLWHIVCTNCNAGFQRLHVSAWVHVS